MSDVVETERGVPRLVAIGLIGGLVAIAIVAVLGIDQGREAVAAVDEVDRSHDTIEALDEVMARLGEAKSARRAYGLSGESSFREVYRNAAATIPVRLDEVERLVDDDVQRQHLATLRPIVAGRLGGLQRQLAARDATGKDTQPDDSTTLANTKIDEAIRREVTAMVDAEHALLASRETESRSRFLRAEVIGVAGAIVAVGLLLAAFRLLLREVRQRRRAEAKTRAALGSAEALNHELEAFAYSVSHDLRAPLRAIDGFSHAVLEDASERLDDDDKRNLERVRAASQRMAQLIDDLLGLSRVTRAPRRDEDVDLSAIAKASIDELREANPGRTFDVTIAPGLVAHGDSRLLRIVFDNLLGNAVKFTARRDVARIEVGSADGAYFIRDDGVGFDAKYVGKLFGAFQRLHDNSEFTGTGIGLATVQRIVRRHGGRVWATGEVDHGATFWFTL